MLRLSFLDASDKRLVRKLAKLQPSIIGVLTTKLNALLFMLQRYIVTEKLSGQVLHHRTGVLAGSVHVIPAAPKGASLYGGEVRAAGGTAFYGAIHEYGGAGAYEIVATRARALAFMMDGKRVFATRVQHPPAKIRAFMAPSLEENRAEINAQIQAALTEAMNEPTE